MISTVELRWLGVLRADAGGFYVYHFEKQPGVHEIHQLRVTWDPVRGTVKLIRRINQTFVEQEFSITLSISGLVENFSFVCPETGRRVKHLYYIDGSFGSRYAKGLSYSYGTTALLMPVRPRPKRQRAKRSSAPLTETTARRSQLETRAALLKGKPWMRHEGPDWFEEKVRPFMNQRLKAPARGPLGPETAYEIWEDHPRLDLRVLMRAGVVRPGRFLASQLAWMDPQLMRAMLYADLRDPDRACLYLDMDLPDWKTGYQVIDLIRPRWGAHAWYMRSQSCGPVQVMAFREGCFGARQEQCLVHASQRRPRRTA